MRNVPYRLLLVASALAAFACSTTRMADLAAPPPWDGGSTGADAGPESDGGVPADVLLEDDEGHVFASAMALDLGGVQLSTRAARALFIRNDTVDAVSLESVVLEPAGGPFAVSELAVPLAIAAGARQELSVSFDSAAAGQFQATLSLRLSGAKPRTLLVSLHAVAAAKCLLVEPQEIDFGTVGVGCGGAGQVVHFYNDCANAVTVDSIELAANAGAFLIRAKPATPFSLGSQSRFGVEVVYLPRAEAPVGESASLEVVQSGARVAVPLSGTALENPLQTDSYTRPPPPKRDILLVIDDSPAMTPLQASVARNLAAFGRYLSEQYASYHVAVTTTSVGGANDANGRFLPLTGDGPAVLTNTMADFEQLFAARVAVGTAGNPDPKLIRPAYLALSDPLLHGHNSGFLRPDADLLIFVVSNAADTETTPIGYYESFLVGLKGRPYRNRLAFSGIVPWSPSAPAGCAYASADAGQSPRVMELVQHTGGLAHEICDPDWGYRIRLEPTCCWGGCGIDRIQLSKLPSMAGPEPLVVTIDGALFEQYGPRGDKRWEYDSVENAIEFDPLAIPDFSSTASVSYHPQCQPQ